MKLGRVEKIIPIGIRASFCLFHQVVGSRHIPILKVITFSHEKHPICIVIPAFPEEAKQRQKVKIVSQGLKSQTAMPCSSG